MTKIIKDNIIQSLQRGGGISYYWSEIYNEMASDFEIYLVNDASWRRYSNIKDNLEAPHLVHSSYYRISKNRFAKNITTVHDFIYEYFTKGIRKRLHTYQKCHALSHSKGIICISENTKKDLLSLYPEYSDKEIVVIHNGFNTLDVVETEVGELSCEEEFYLFVGSRANYKNFHLAVKIAELSKVKLVIVGGGALTHSEVAALKNNITCFNHFLWVQDSELKWLYKNALALLYPSQYEGFGMPPLEAFYQGCFAFCLDTPSNREIYGEYMPLFTKEDPSSAIKFIKNSKKETESICRSSLYKKFNWEKCSKETKYFLEYNATIENLS